MPLARTVFFPALMALAAGCTPTHGPPAHVRWRPMDAGANNWIRHGPIEVSVESARLEPVKLRPPSGAEATAEAFVVATRTRFCGGKQAPTVLLFPVQPVRSTLIGGPVVLEDDAGNRYEPLDGLEYVIGRRAGEAMLNEDQPEVADLLLFDPRAGLANDLTITIPSFCRVRDAHGRDVPQPTDRPPFRFRLLRWMWEAKSPGP